MATTSSCTSPTRRTHRWRARRARWASGPTRCACCPVDATSGCAPTLLAAAIDADAPPGARPLFVVGNAGATNTGAVDPLRRAGRDRRAARRVAARRRGLRRLRRAHRARPRGAARASSSPTRSRSIRTSGSTSRSSAAACSCARARAAARLRDDARLPRRRRGRGGGGQLRRPRPAAHARAPRVQALAVVARSAPRAFRAAIDALARPRALAEPRVREHAGRSSCCRPPCSGIVCFRRRFEGGDDAGRAQRRARGARSRRPGVGLVSSTRLRRPVRDPDVRAQPHHPRRRRRGDAGLARDRRRPPAPHGTARGIGRPGARQATSPGIRPASAPSPPARAPASRCSPGSTRCGGGARRRARDAEARTAGEAMVRRFESGRDFFVILDGAVDVLRRRPRRARARAAATSSASSPRSTGAPATATRGSRPSVAATDLRLAKLTAGTLRALRGRCPRSTRWCGGWRRSASRSADDVGITAPRWSGVPPGRAGWSRSTMP